VPIFTRLKLGAVLGYHRRHGDRPWGLRLISDPQTELVS
jgi:hypothetical protein